MIDQFAAIQGASIRYRDSGGNGPPVLMTHGIGESLEFWHRQFDALGPSMRLIAWDMPGHGLSDELKTAMDLQGQARVAWQLLDHLGIDRAFLVGNSLGAAMSMRMLAQARPRVCGQLLASAAALGQDVFVAFRLMTLPLVGELLTRPGPTAVAQQIRAIVHRPEAITPIVRAAIERNVRRPGGARHFLALLRGLTTLQGQRPAVWKQSHQILREMQVPTLIIHGEQDSVLPVHQSRQAKAMLPWAELVTLPHCGHTPQLEQAEIFNSHLQRLVR